MYKMSAHKVKTNSNAMNIQQIILIVTATSTALISGLFFAYSCSVNIALGKLSDAIYIVTMQSINREIQNPMFFSTFIGTLLLLPLCTWMQYKIDVSNTFLLLMAATIIYFVGTFGVTMLGNVPLNESLDKINLQSATLEEISKLRIQFEVPWNKLHTIRTLCSVVSLVLVLIALTIGQNYDKVK
jgi:uncharacterized membrane protein